MDGRRIVYSGRIAGTSMLPLLREKQDAVTVTAPTRPPRKYDVVFYYDAAQEKFLLHRVIRITAAGYVMRGDNCYYTESPIPGDRVLGVMTSYTRNGRVKKLSSWRYRLYARIRVWDYPVRHFFHRVKRRISGHNK